jgi:hypothetical protein
LADLVVSCCGCVLAQAGLGFEMMKRILLVFAFGGLLALPAYAFEKTGAPGSGTPVETETVPLGLSEDKAVNKKSVEGGLVFPSLSALGVLPKLDFGLELLYGENQPQVVVPEENNSDSDGLRIQGTLKHRF